MTLQRLELVEVVRGVLLTLCKIAVDVQFPCTITSNAYNENYLICVVWANPSILQYTLTEIPQLYFYLYLLSATKYAVSICS